MSTNTNTTTFGPVVILQISEGNNFNPEWTDTVIRPEEGYLAVNFNLGLSDYDAEVVVETANLERITTDLERLGLFVEVKDQPTERFEFRDSSETTYAFTPIGDNRWKLTEAS